MSLFNPTLGIVITSSTALLTSFAILLTNEYISKLKIRYTKLRGWINVITFLFEKILQQLMIGEKVDEKESDELKKVFIHYLDKREKVMKILKSK